jgi:hypothetical protein
MKCRDFSPRRHEGHEASLRNVIVVVADVSPFFVPSCLRGKKLESSREYGPGAVICDRGFFCKMVVQAIAPFALRGRLDAGGTNLAGQIRWPRMASPAKHRHPLYES